MAYYFGEMLLNHERTRQRGVTEGEAGDLHRSALHVELQNVSITQRIGHGLMFDRQVEAMRGEQCGDGRAGLVQDISASGQTAIIERQFCANGVD